MKFKRLYFSVVLCLTTLMACNTDNTCDQSHLVFRYNEHSDITSLDPAFAKDQRNIWAVHQLYNTLISLDDSLNLQPELAKTWSIGKDGLTYTFNLRDDILFHQSKIFNNSNRILTAEDVVFSLKRLTDPQLASPGSWIMKPVESVKSLDRLTVEIKLKHNFPAFLGLLTMKYCSVVPKEVQSGKINFRSNPIGTGAFQFKRWIPQEKLVFRKNPLYFETDSIGRQLPYLEAIAISFLPDKQSEFMQFIQGNLDFMSGLDVSYKDELLKANGQLKLKYKDQIVLDKSPYLNTEYIGFYLANSESDIYHKSLRQAINYGFDRQKMIKYLRNGIGIPANQGFIPKGLPGYGDFVGYSYNPKKAKNLVKEYITKTGNKTPEVTISTNPLYVDLIEFIQSELEKIGIKVIVDVLPASTLRQKRSSGQLESFRASWIADYPDAQNYLSLFYSKNKSPNGPNYTHFESDIYDSIYNRSLKVSNQKKRFQYYRQLDSLIIKEAALVPLFYDEVIRFKQDNIEGLGINPVNLLDLKRVYKSK